MTQFISLQGAMASGKTTLAQKIAEQDKSIFMSYEDISKPSYEVKSLGLDKFKKDDFFEIQRIFINAEIERVNNLKLKYDKVIFDLGPEEIEFYTLFFPKALGKNWNVEEKLHYELDTLRKCMPQKIFFLDLSLKSIIQQKNQDLTRKRNFFDFYIEKLHSLKIEWFHKKKNVEFINVEELKTNNVINLVVSAFKKEK